MGLFLSMSDIFALFCGAAPFPGLAGMAPARSMLHGFEPEMGESASQV